MSIEVRRVDAFTRDEAGGNPAGVVLSAETLSPDTMQAIAAKLGYSETAFLTARTARDYEVRFFAPKKEVAICGHATVALFHVLAETTGLRGATRMRPVSEVWVSQLRTIGAYSWHRKRPRWERGR